MKNKCVPSKYVDIVPKKHKRITEEKTLQARNTKGRKEGENWELSKGLGF